MGDKMETDKRIIKFKIAGMKPDVRLKVFDNLEFHVHSALLKLHSGFFRKFLDSPEKIVPASKEFSYEWVTKIDEDGSWHLVAAQALKDQDENNPPKLKGRQSHEEKTFERLLKAIYSEPYELDAAKDLVRLTGIADYYCALRMVSKSLDAVILHSSDFQMSLQDEACQIMPAAYRLRNVTLFRECLVFLLSDWADLEWKRLESDILRSVAVKVQASIYALIGEVNEAILSSLFSLSQRHPENHKTTWEFMQFAFTTAQTTCNGKIIMSLPHYYRMLLDYIPTTQFANPFIQYQLIHLLENTATYNFDLEAGSRATNSEDSFYCAWIDDKDLPWDTTEDDW